MTSIEIPFTKMSGAGNDFVVVDNTRGQFKIDWSAFAKVLCERHYGVGADGLLVLAPSSEADFTMFYYNADGSSGGMCGNGGRCCVLLAHEQGIEHDDISFEALGYLYRATFTGDGIRLAMKDPEHIRRGILVHTSAGKFICHAVDTGSPHVVTFVDDLDKIDVVTTGRELRGHNEFMPEGANVDFVKVLGKDAIAIRTYERGVEAETLACGTGSIAAALIAALERGVPSPVTVHTRSGGILRVGFKMDGEKLTSIYLEGHACIVFSAKILYDSFSNKVEPQVAI
jgi:diaminopimelate epimerase